MIYKPFQDLKLSALGMGAMKNHSEHFMELTSVEVSDIMAINLDRAFVYIIETHQKFYHGCFSRSGRTYDSYLLAIMHIC